MKWADLLHADKNYLVGMLKNGRDLLDYETVKSGVSHKSFDESRRLLEWFLRAHNDRIIYGLTINLICTFRSIPGGVLRERLSENMQQIYWTPMPKYNVSKDGKQFYWNHTSAWVLFCKFAANFQNIFS